jgi:hypothetical protein
MRLFYNHNLFRQRRNLCAAVYRHSKAQLDLNSTIPEYKHVLMIPAEKVANEGI